MAPPTGPRKLNHAVSNQQVNYIKERFGIEVEAGSGYHSHPISALGRALAREDIRRRIAGLRSLNVGGNPIWWATRVPELRTGPCRPIMHHLCPIMTPADAARQKQRELYALQDSKLPARMRHPMQYCNHALKHWVEGECQCFAEIDCLVSVHSIYYLEPEELLRAIMRTKQGFCLAVAHVYTTPMGVAANGEMTWRRVGDEITVSVNGGAIYTHRVPDWLVMGQLRVGDYYLVAHPLADYDNHRLFMVTYAPVLAEARAYTLAEAVASDSYFGPVKAFRDTRGFYGLGPTAQTATYAIYELEKGRAWSCGKYIRLYYRENETVFLPKEVVNAAAAQVVFRERTTATLTDCARAAAAALRRLEIPTQDTSQITIVAAAVAFVLNLDLETEVLEGIDKTKIKEHNEARELKAREYSCIAGIVAALKRRLKRRPKENKHMPKLKAIENVDVCFEEKPLKARSEGTHIDVPVEVCHPKVGTTRVGPTIQLHTAQATVARSCAHNEAIAVNNRGLMEVPAPEEHAWEEAVEALVATAPHLIERMPEAVQPTPFMEWVSRFPAGRKARLIAAKTWSTLGGKVSSNIALEAFVKREVIIKDGEYDPRLIQGTDLLYQASFGPHQHAYQKELMRVMRWDGESAPGFYPVYTGGMTAEELGDLVGKITKQFPHHKMLMQDQSRYDAHCGQESQLAAARFYGMTGMTPEGVSLARLQAGQKSGRTPHGVTYRCVATTSSGVPDTSIKGTILNAASIADGLRTYARAHPDTNSVVIGLFMGDDNLIFGEAEVIAHLVAQYPNGTSRLGLEASLMKVADTLDEDVEYCSGRFWRVGGDIVFGPKPGRQLAKLFLKVGKVDKPEKAAREIALGFRDTASCVPILSEAVERVLELTSHVRAKALKDEYKMYAARAHKYDMNTLNQFCAIYDCTKDEIRECIREVRSKPLDGLLTNPLFTRLVQADTE